ncbi:MAG TPA: hypothetical protein VN843_11550 [Anaerolineales bacterium]|nr:hypothetical protein [Anaerolineales bacterium]
MTNHFSSTYQLGDKVTVRHPGMVIHGTIEAVKFTFSSVTYWVNGREFESNEITPFTTQGDDELILVSSP